MFLLPKILSFPLFPPVRSEWVRLKAALLPFASIRVHSRLNSIVDLRFYLPSLGSRFEAINR